MSLSFSSSASPSRWLHAGGEQCGGHNQTSHPNCEILKWLKHNYIVYWRCSHAILRSHSCVWWPPNVPESPTNFGTENCQWCETHRFQMYFTRQSYSLLSAGSLVLLHLEKPILKWKQQIFFVSTEHWASSHCKYHIVICHLKPFNTVFRMVCAASRSAAFY